MFQLGADTVHAEICLLKLYIICAVLAAIFSDVSTISLSNADATFAQSTRMQRFLKFI